MMLAQPCEHQMGFGGSILDFIYGFVAVDDASNGHAVFQQPGHSAMSSVPENTL